MNYYLWTAGKEHGPYTLEQIKEALIEGTITIQQTARRADSHDWVALGTIIELPSTAVIPGPDKPEAAPPPARPRKDVKEYLEHVRENSCYGVLRSIIEVVTALTVVAAVFAIAGGVFYLIKREMAFGLYGVGTGVGSIILIIGARQGALLLIDIADTLLHHHSKTRP
jgi:hypothetical protein